MGRVPVNGKVGLERDTTSMAIINVDARALGEAKAQKSLYTERNKRLTELENRVSNIENGISRLEALLIKSLEGKG